MRRRELLQWMGTSTLAAGLGAARRASAAETIKIGTLMPKSSPWGQVFSTWTKAVDAKSGGQLSLQFFMNGQQGDEAAMVGKMKSGQLDGAFLTAVGLSKIYKPILALQMPGLFTAWSKLDVARDTMKEEFEKGASDAGFKVTGWSDVGLTRWMTKGISLKLPETIKGTKPYMWRDDAVQPILFQVLGGVSPVPLNTPEVLPNLNTGAINIVSSAPLMGEQLQWTGKLDTLVDEVISACIGAQVFSSKRLDAMPADLRAILLDTGKVATAALTKRIRDEDNAALGRIKGKMTVLSLSADEKTKWSDIYKQTRQKLAQGTFSPELVAKLEGLAAS